MNLKPHTTSTVFPNYGLRVFNCQGSTYHRCCVKLIPRTPDRANLKTVTSRREMVDT